MKTLFLKLFAIAGVLTVALVFQNCQKASYGASGKASSDSVNGTLSAIDTTTGTVTTPPTNNGGGEPGSNHGSTGGGSSNPPDTSNNGGSTDHHDGHSCVLNDDDDDNSVDNDDDDDSSGHCAANYVCILDGPGKSIKLGVSDGGTVQGQNPVPGVLCMCKQDCLAIAGQAFAVQGAYKRGYCKDAHGDPHVRHISGDELQDKINDVKSSGGAPCTDGSHGNGKNPSQDSKKKN